jgi:glycerol-3-phosphate acyltransferase PlsY
MTLSLIGILAAYLLGAIPFGYIIAKYWGKIDILKEGSGNIGATNALRTMGKRAGISVLILDLLKGLAAVVVFGIIFYKGNIPVTQLSYIYILGLAAICGHIWTIFLSFKGGKGVSTTLGVLIGLIFYDSRFGIVLLLAFALWILIVSVSKYVSLGSISAAVFLPIGLLIFIGNMPVFIFGCLVALIVVYSHRTNIKRLLSHSEKKIKF